MAQTTPIQQFPYPELTDAPNVPLYMQQLAEAIEKRVVAVYDTVADRNTKNASPADGMASYLRSDNTFWLYMDSAWVKVYPLAVPAITSGSAVPSNSTGTDGDIFLKV